jgi:hypothetical protein
MRNKITVVLALLTALAIMPSAAQAVAVDLELVLLVDVSGSVDTSEYDTQISGYVAAFDDATIQGKIAAGNGIAVCLVQWSGVGQQDKSVDWTLITDATSSAAFADAIEGISRPFTGTSALTAPGDAIDYAVAELASDNGYEGDREVIDVSGDGSQNDPTSSNADDTDDARDAADSAGIVINGLAILTDEADLDDWYTAHVKTPTGFVVVADDFTDFEATVNRKILSEVTGTVPEPLTMAAMFMGVAGIAGYIRKRRAA